MPTTTRGNEAEAQILCALVRRGFDVLTPFGDGSAYDLAVDLGEAFLRVQCKRAWPVGGCLVLTREARITAAALAPTVEIGGVAEFEGRLRLAPARNNQRRRIRMAAEFEIDRWSEEALSRVARDGQRQSQSALLA